MATIVIDPGHYDEYNKGVCTGYYEGKAMLVLAQYLSEALIKKGANVIYTRSSNDENPTLEQRGAMAKDADLFISLHSDASDNPAVRGVTSYYSVKRPQSEPFASDIGKAVANAMGNEFKGSIARPSQTTPNTDYLGVLRAAVATGVPNAFLIENGYHTNMEDCLTLSNSSSMWTIANAMANVIAKHLNFCSSEGCNIRYTVNSGEYLYSISHKFGISWQDIAKANNIGYPYTVYPGQQLIIPFPADWCC